MYNSHNLIYKKYVLRTRNIYSSEVQINYIEGKGYFTLIINHMFLFFHIKKYMTLISISLENIMEDT